MEWLAVIAGWVWLIWHRLNMRTPEEILRAAVHEAGHAVVALQSPLLSEVEVVSIKRKPLEDGDTAAIFDKTENFEELDWELLVFSIGGLAAELVVFGKYEEAGLSYDINKISSHAGGLICFSTKYSTDHISPICEKLFPRETYSIAAINANDNRLRLLTATLEEATKRIKKEHKLFKNIVKKLILKTTLKEKDLNKLVRKYSNGN